MKTWHLLAATAWVALFLWLARAAAGLREESHATFEGGIAFALVTALLWVVTVPVALVLGECLLAGCRDCTSTHRWAGCLGIIAATAVVGAAIWLFRWFGAG